MGRSHSCTLRLAILTPPFWKKTKGSLECGMWLKIAADLKLEKQYLERVVVEHLYGIFCQSSFNARKDFFLLK